MLFDLPAGAEEPLFLATVRNPDLAPTELEGSRR
jgi:hypothetical protein